MKSLTMCASLVLMCFYVPNAYAQSSDYDVAQYFKGKICDIKVGSMIGDLLQDGETLQVEKFSGEGNAYFVFHVNILDCGIVRVYAGDQWMEIFRLETEYVKYSTKRGAKVGMTLKEIKELYPDGKIRNPTSDSIDFSVSFYLPNDEGQFDFNAEELREKCEDNIDGCLAEIKSLRADIFVTY